MYRMGPLVAQMAQPQTGDHRKLKLGKPPCSRAESPEERPRPGAGVRAAKLRDPKSPAAGPSIL